jgi:hypothetical protein
MKKEDFVSLVAHLEKALESFGVAGIKDTRIVPIYAEYLVALKLAEVRREVEVVNRRSYDILVNGNVRVEVKSGKYEDGCAAASFGKGGQIRDAKFDYCIFVSYDGPKVREILVFNREELKEVANKPRGRTVVRYPKTNPCILLRYDNVWDYYAAVEQQEWLEIEVELHKHPERFLNRWDKITTQQRQGLK